MLHLLEKYTFHNQNLSFTQPSGGKGSVDNLMNSLTLQWFLSNNNFIHYALTFTHNLLYIVLEHGTTVISEDR